MNTSQRCRTTGRYNNCGLNGVVHFLFDQLAKETIQARYRDHMGYQTLLETFQKYYDLRVTPTWEGILALLKPLIPTDREAILGLVLRQYLATLIIQNPADIWDGFACMAYQQYLYKREAIDNAGPVFQANRAWFEKDKVEFDREWEISRIRAYPGEKDDFMSRWVQKGDHAPPPTEEEKAEGIRELRREKVFTTFTEEAKKQWILTGSRQYAEYLSKLENAVLVSREHLGILGNALNFDVQIFTPQFGVNLDVDNASSRDVMVIYNVGIHWEYVPQIEDPDCLKKKVEEHNRYYPNLFYADFYDDEMLSGKFKMHGNNKENDVDKIQRIKEYVRTQWGKPKVAPTTPSEPVKIQENNPPLLYILIAPIVALFGIILFGTGNIVFPLLMAGLMWQTLAPSFVILKSVPLWGKLMAMGIVGGFWAKDFFVMKAREAYPNPSEIIKASAGEKEALKMGLEEGLTWKGYFSSYGNKNALLHPVAYRKGMSCAQEGEEEFIAAIREGKESPRS